MPGLCTVALQPHLDVGPLLDTMLNRLAHYPWLGAVRHVAASGRVGLGEVTFERHRKGAIAVSPDQQRVAVLYGELFDAAAERRRLEQRGVRFETSADAELLLHGWHVERETLLARLNGEFAAAIWDGAEGALHLVTDRFGLRPLYIAQTGGSFIAASEIKSVLALPGVDTSWSEQGVASFFSFGHFFGDETLLRGVHAMPPATVGTYRLADGRYDEASYWQVRPGAASRSPGELAASFERAFVTAVERRAQPGEHLGLSLSGGLDARAILGVVPAGVDLKTVSLGIDGSLNHQSAAELAAIAGVPHHQYVLDASFLSSFEEHLRQMVLLTDGHYLDQGIVMPTMTIYRQLGIESLMRGHGGELLHMKKAYSLSLDAAALRASEAELESWLLAHLTDYMLTGVPDDLFTIDLRAGAAAALRRALDRCQPAEAPVDRVWQLFLNERIHRETALSMHMFGSFTTIRQPYLDNDVIDALFAMPAGMKLGDQLQTHLLRDRRPAFLGVINSNTGAPLGAGRLANGVARFRMRVFAKLGVKGYQPYERLGLWLRQELRGLVESVLTSERFLDSRLFRPDAVRRVVSQHLSNQANHTFLIMALLILGIGTELRDASQTRLAYSSQS